MMNYVVLIRGINVGGKNIVPMAGLRQCLEEKGYSNISTYIASGNVILQSTQDASELKTQVEAVLLENFKLDSGLAKILVLTHKQFKAIIEQKPQGFGEQPEEYHSDAIFLIDIDTSQAMTAFDPRAGVDTYWTGDGVIYSQRLSSQRTKSRLNKTMSTSQYQSMTIRNWNTTTKLLELLENLDTHNGA
jgi:uncharacterized protein (DUF1697 family)